MKKAIPFLLALGSVIGLSAQLGCSGIRVVRESKTGGEIALLGGREGAMEKANAEMARKCGGPGTYEIVEQGEVVVGETSSTNTNSTTSEGKTWSGKPATKTKTTSTTDTNQKTEWRVIYECRGPGAAPIATAPPAGGDVSPSGGGAPAASVTVSVSASAKTMTLRVPIL